MDKVARNGLPRGTGKDGPAHALAEASLERVDQLQAGEVVGVGLNVGQRLGEGRLCSRA